MRTWRTFSHLLWGLALAILRSHLLAGSSFRSCFNPQISMLRSCGGTLLHLVCSVLFFPFVFKLRQRAAPILCGWFLCFDPHPTRFNPHPRRRPDVTLVAQAEPCNQCAIAVGAFLTKISEQPPAVTNHEHQAITRMQ